MFRKITAGSILIPIVAGVLAIFNGCGEVSHSDNYAVITGRVLNSVADPTGVQDVMVWVESDPTSDVAYLGGDISIKTDQNGIYEAEIFLGYQTIRDRPEEETGGTFSVDFPQYVGDARLLMLYQDMYYDLGGGFSIQRGRTLNVWDVYLSEFLPMGSDGPGIGEKSLIFDGSD
jgi:hypothetical protein